MAFTFASQSAAGAAPGWVLPGERVEVPGGRIALTAGGTLAIVGEKHTDSASALEANVRPAGGTFTATTLDSGPAGSVGPFPAGLFADTNGGFLTLWSPPLGVTPRPLRAAYRPSGGSWALLTNPAADPTTFALGTSPSGQVYLVFVEGGKTYVSVRPPGSGNFPTPTQLNVPEPKVSGMAIAGNDAGDAIITYTPKVAGGVVAYRRSGATGTWTSAATLDTTGSLSGDSLAIDANGNAFVAWLREQTSGADHVQTIGVAYAPAGAAFGSADLSRTATYTPVEPFGAEGDSFGPLEVSFDRQGVAHLVYERISNESASTLRDATHAADPAAPTSADTVIGALTETGGPRFIGYSLAALSDGTLLAFVQDAVEVVSYTRSAGGSWGPRTVLGCSESIDQTGTLVSDGASKALATWSDASAPGGFLLAAYGPTALGTARVRWRWRRRVVRRRFVGARHAGRDCGERAGGGERSFCDAAGVRHVFAGARPHGKAVVRGTRQAEAPRRQDDQYRRRRRLPAARAGCTASGSATVAGAAAGAAKRTVVGRIAIRIRAGKSAAVRFMLNRAGRTLLRRKRQLRMTLALTLRGARSTTLHRTITVRAPRRRG